VQRQDAQQADAIHRVRIRTPPISVLRDTDLIDSNDAVVPIDKSYAGCQWSDDGLCAFDTVVAALQDRIKEIDFQHDCFAN